MENTCKMECYGCTSQPEEHKMRCAIFMQISISKEILENQNFIKKNLENVALKTDEIHVKTHETTEKKTEFKPVNFKKDGIENTEKTAQDEKTVDSGSEDGSEIEIEIED